MVKELKEIGVDYLTIKPYSPHLYKDNMFELDYQDVMDIGRELEQYRTEHFSVYFRANSVENLYQKKEYKKCHGLPFMTHIDSKGNVWPCVALVDREGYCYGNIYEQDFNEIWEGTKRKDVAEKINMADRNTICRMACRLDEINKYLDELKHPGEHVNFI